MRIYAIVFFFLLSSLSLWAQKNQEAVLVKGLVTSEQTLLPLEAVNIINLNRVKAVMSDRFGRFEIVAAVNDTLHFSMIGYQPIKVRVTNDWISAQTMTVRLTEKAYALEEVIIQPYRLTGYIEVDSKLIPIENDARYRIAGMNFGYEVGKSSPGAFKRALNSLSNPADMLYKFFNKDEKQLRKLRDASTDSNLKQILESKYDRETLAALLGVDKAEIPELLSRCSYSDTFAKTASDLQILEALSECYEEYRILNKKRN